MKIGMSPEIASASVGADKPTAAATTAAATAAAATAATSAAATAQAAGAKKAPEASTKIELSSTATALLAGMPDDGSFDAEKVSRITQAITDGKFTVNAEAIADKLIANAREVLGRAQRH